MNRQLSARRGFTLVEILVAITVIAILGGMLLAGLFPALRRAQEMAAFTELKQVEQGIESFKTKFGFYPPSFVQFHNLNANDRVALMRRYLNRISPNHQESPARIQAWFAARGNSMNPNLGHDIVFWLSGLFKNKQFPLTGSAAGVIPDAYSTPATSGDLREIHFEFAPKRLVVAGGVAGYSQIENTPSPMVYLDSASYPIELTDSPAYQSGNWPEPRKRNVGYWRINSGNLLQQAAPTLMEFNSGVAAFENPNTFQLFFSGIDTQCGDSNCTTGFNVRALNLVDSDNLVNFANGRLDSYANSLTD
jgi:prepilin-type N-terminal cleavage/methylation domain-containing protein